MRCRPWRRSSARLPCVCVCVLLDITLAHFDGLELAKMIRHRCGDDVVLIAVTGSPTSHPRVAEALALVDHHFMKPLDLMWKTPSAERTEA